jgi:hypothetical protein
MLDSAGLGQGDYAVVKVGGMAQRFADLTRAATTRQPYYPRPMTWLSAPACACSRASKVPIKAMSVPRGAAGQRATRICWSPTSADISKRYAGSTSRLNKSQACDILARNVSALTPELAAASYPVLLDPNRGFFRDGRMREDGVLRVLNLRSRYAAEQRTLSDPSRYVDHHYWDLAQGS